MLGFFELDPAAVEVEAAVEEGVHGRFGHAVPGGDAVEEAGQGGAGGIEDLAGGRRREVMRRQLRLCGKGSRLGHELGLSFAQLAFGECGEQPHILTQHPAGRLCDADHRSLARELFERHGLQGLRPAGLFDRFEDADETTIGEGDKTVENGVVDFLPVGRLCGVFEGNHAALRIRLAASWGGAAGRQRGERNGSSAAASRLAGVV
ncbi:hypothetical protein ACQ5SO_02445 [Rhodovulum sp. DZ06]|uniref:hypothetical protein n=1 Tax=Rhodovulum sp. DZ06 TaxID=3425126 RepID=UPI003D34633B